MSTADTPSEAAAVLARARWGNTVAVRAAETLIARKDQVPDPLKAEVLQALGQDGDNDGE
jgi:hypothetical protein